MARAEPMAAAHPLRARFLYGALIVGALAALLVVDRLIGNPLFFSLVALAAIVLSIGEFGSIVRASGARFDGAPVAFYAAALVALKVPALVPRSVIPAPGPELLVLAVMVLHLVARSVVSGDVEGAIRRLGADVLAYVWLVLGLSAFLDILAGYGVGTTLAAIAVAKSHDIGALLVGRSLGRRKLAPKVSPNKSVEGAIGGVLLSLVAAGLSALLLEAPAIAGPRFLLFGFVVSLAAMLGDLVESLVKRDAGVKDSAGWIPGFGGVLDMTDSLTLAGPVALATLAGLARI